MWKSLIENTKQGDIKSLARCISFVENEAEGYEQMMESLQLPVVPIIGITGPPGAGKSTLTDCLVGGYVARGGKVAVLCVDPSSPFNLGALLGDRIRLSQWYNNPSVFIRSLATRGSLGGLHPKIIEIADIVKLAGFDHIIIETVGVGQSEIEIAGLADVTIVTIVPEAGDEIQTMKAGLMEIADIFVVNKADRPGADTFVKNLRMMLAPAFSNHSQEIPVLKTVASKQEGIVELQSAIEQVLIQQQSGDKKSWLLAEKAWHLLQVRRMKGITKKDLKDKIEATEQFNMYRFIKQF
jgi:LAO/AO transport system kinase